MRACLSYGLYVFKVYHRDILLINDSVNKLQLRMQEPQVPFESVSTQNEFKSYLQWPNNKTFNYEWSIDHSSGSRVSEA